MIYENIKNQEIKSILAKHEHYDYMTGKDLQKFYEYRNLINAELKHKNFVLRNGIYNGIRPEHYTYLEQEVEQINYANRFFNPDYCVSSCYYMNAVLRHLWDMEFSGYCNNPFFDFQKLVKMVNCYWDIKEPYKAPNKIAYGWKFSMEKAEGKQGYYSKNWKLYMWGCIKNYLIKNGVEFTKEESLKVRKIVGLADIYDTTE